ncbi:LLM class flavin-dependent oxidoreductase [Occultella glacieicola]|uniref:LLM class flavin-dependent oxidoreductase n=1 Tax=Occultella glacieicola TaxID=2518684 RepID=A0ABY2E1C5_9MICO|nr:LLM class flavin-dependent oxidoreductase [Occultella glacieicola]TDE91627.1 LLM class flavin-dependent oxidoreductase [Occultella glacieicola]
MTSFGIVFPPDQPPERLRDVAMAADSAGLDELWLWEDCFAESGVAPAAAVLAWTENLRVGIGLIPVPLRNVAITAMEIATISRLFPGRFLPGVGHGVLDWMGQVGVRAKSPLTLLREYTVALRALLDGETVTTSGEYVHLDDVRLRYPPQPPPPLLIGAIKPRTLALAGELGDGVLLGAGDESPEAVLESVRVATEARERAGAFEVTMTVNVPVDASAEHIEAAVRPYLAVGVDRVPVCGLDAAGMPDGSDRLLGLVAEVASARSRLV